MTRLLARIMRHKPVSAPVTADPAQPDPWHLNVTFTPPAGYVRRLVREGSALSWDIFPTNHYYA